MAGQRSLEAVVRGVPTGGYFMVRLTFLGLAIVVLALTLAGGGRAQGQPDPAAAVADLQMRVAALEARLGARPVGTAVAEGVRFQGEGDVVSEPFGLRAGLLVARVVGRGAGEVQATLFTAGGKRIPFGAKELPYEGTLAESVPETGNYVLAVESEGSWSGLLRQ